MKYPRLYRKRAKPEKKEYSQRMRKNPTIAERMLWKELKGKKLGVKFTRQKIIMGWIVDFYSPIVSLVIELDGEYHENQKSYDSYRDSKINELGISIIRIPNEVVINNMPEALEFIKENIRRAGYFK